MDEIKKDILIWVFMGVMVLGLISAIRFGAISPEVPKDDVCKAEFGEDWIYEYNKYFGRTCVKIDFVTLEISSRESLNFTNKELINKYCEDVGFLEFKKWGNPCYNKNGEIYLTEEETLQLDDRPTIFEDDWKITYEPIALFDENPIQPMLKIWSNNTNQKEGIGIAPPFNIEINLEQCREVTCKCASWGCLAYCMYCEEVPNSDERGNSNG